MLTKNKYLNTAYFWRKNQLVNLFLFISEKHKFYVNLPNFTSLITTIYRTNDWLILQKIITDSSKVLYSATRHRAYFRKVFFLIPSTWSSGLADKDSTSVNLRDADIIISDPSSVSRRSYPRTRSYAGCGHRGIHIQLRTDVLFNSRHPLVQGKPGKYQYILTNVHGSLFIITTDDHEMLIFAQSSVKLQLHFVLYFNIKKNLFLLTGRLVEYFGIFKVIILVIYQTKSL